MMDATIGAVTKATTEAPQATTTDLSTKSAATTCAWYRGETYEVQDSIGYLMHQVVLTMRRDIEWRMSQHELTAAQWQPLWMIKAGKGSTPQELAKSLCQDAGAVSRSLDRLEAKQLLKRTRSLSDRRVVDLELTEAGHAVVANVPHVLASINNECLAGFSREEWDQLRGFLGRLLDNARALPGSQEVTS